MRFHVANVNVVVSGLRASIQRSCHAECQRKCAMLRCFNTSARKSSPCSERSGCEREKVRPARFAVVKNETKFALHTHNKRKCDISNVPGEFLRAYWLSDQVRGPCGTLHTGSGGGTTRSRSTACRRHAGPSCRAFSPLHSVAFDCVGAGFLRVLMVAPVPVGGAHPAQL